MAGRGGRPKRKTALAATKARSHEQDDWVNKSNKKGAEKIKYVKDRFSPVFADIDCMLGELMVEFFKGKNDIQFSRSKPTLDIINDYRRIPRREKTDDEIVRDSYLAFHDMIDNRLMKKIVNYPCFEFYNIDDNEDENGDLFECIKKETSSQISTHIVICQRRNILTRARTNAPWTKACQGDKFDKNYFVCSSDDEYILTKVTKGPKKFQKKDLFIMKEHFDREKKCWVHFDHSMAVFKNSCPIGIRIQFDAGKFEFKTFEKSTVGDHTKKIQHVLSAGNGQIIFFKNSDYIDKTGEQSLLTSIMTPQTSTPKKQPEQKQLNESFELELEGLEQPGPLQPEPSQPEPSQPGSSQPGSSQQSSQLSTRKNSSQPETTYHDAMAEFLKQKSLPINFQFDGETGKIVPKLGGITLKYDPRHSRKELLKLTHDAELDEKFLTDIKKAAFRKELTKNPEKYQLIRLSDVQEENNKKHYKIANADQYDYRFLEIIQIKPDKENEVYNPITGNQFYDHLKCSILKNIFSMFPPSEEHILILRNILKMFFKIEQLGCSICKLILFQGYWMCLANRTEAHERLVNVKCSHRGKIQFPHSAAVKKLQVDRHVKKHKEKEEDLTERNEMIKTMNYSFIMKTSAMSLPTNRITPEEVQFLHHLGQLTLKTGLNAVLFLHMDRRTIKADFEDLATELKKSLMDGMKMKLDQIKRSNELKEVMSVSIHFDHKRFGNGSINDNLAGSVLCIKIWENTEETYQFNCPIDLYPIPAKGGKNVEANAKAILKNINMFGGEHLDVFSFQCDGGIVNQSLIDSIGNHKRFLESSIFMCLSHVGFLCPSHLMYYVLDDLDLERKSLFPGHKQRNGKKLFFAYQPEAEASLKTNLSFCLDILDNLTTCSSNQIELRHYIQQLRKVLVTEKAKDTMSLALFDAVNNDPEANEKMITTITQQLSSSDMIAFQKSRFFGASKISKSTCIPVSSGKKARRFADMIEKFTVSYTVADHCARTYFSDKINAPPEPICHKFMSKLAELAVCEKYILSKADANHKANNVTLLRMLAIVSTCAFGLDTEDLSEYSILDNEFIGLV